MRNLSKSGLKIKICKLLCDYFIGFPLKPIKNYAFASVRVIIGQKPVFGKAASAAIGRDYATPHCGLILSPHRLSQDRQAQIAADYGRRWGDKQTDNLSRVKNNRMEQHDFGWALKMLKVNQAVFREGWNGKGQALLLQRPTEQSKMTLPYIYITTVQGQLVPWLASQTDLLADDWEVVEGGE